MRILHTSDWHLGHTLYNYDRSTEQAAFLKQLTAIIAHERPDALLVSGDIYHYSNPSAAAQRLYTENMLAIHRACPDMTIVVIAGNHDSSAKLEVDSSLWKHFRVKVVGSIERTDEGINWDKHIVAVKSPSGEDVGFIAAVPHVYPQNFPPTDTDTTREQRQARFFQTLLDETAKRNPRNLPVALTAHLAVAGSDRTGHDDTVGNMDYVHIDELGTGYDYLALGHIHCPQTLKGSQGRARYCGTPLPVNFDETYPHSVTWVETRAGSDPHIRPIPIDNPMPLITLPASPLPFEDALKELEAYPADRPGYVRLNVLCRDFLTPDCTERASNAMRGKACKFCYIKLNRETPADKEAPAQLSIQDIQEMSPLDIARLYYRENENEEMDEELCELMRTAIRQVKEKRNNA